MRKDLPFDKCASRSVVHNYLTYLCSRKVAEDGKSIPAPPRERRRNVHEPGYDEEAGSVLSKAEDLRLGYKFIFECADAAIRKVLKDWFCRASGSKSERVARSFSVYRLSFLYGDKPAIVFDKCHTLRGSSSKSNSNPPLFNDFGTWLERKLEVPHTLRDVPDDDVLMHKFSTAERAHWLENESQEDATRQMDTDREVDDGEAREDGVVSTPGHSGVEKRLQFPNRTCTEVATFAVSHFARLCLILRDDDEARLAFAGTAHPFYKH